MAWSAKQSGMEELVSKASSTASLHILPFRQFGDAECEALCAALRRSTTLTELHASGHLLGEAGAAALGSLLVHPGCSLRSVAVGDASFGGSGVCALLAGADAATAGPGADGATPSTMPLTSIDLSFKGLQAQDHESLGRLFCRCRALRQLSLARNAGLGDAMAVLASSVAASCEGLRRLDLSAMDLSAAALGALAREGRSGRLARLAELTSRQFDQGMIIYI